MSASLDKLMLTVGLLDKITGPMRGIQKTIQQVTSQSRKAFMNTAAGVTALIAASSSFANTINPANDMNNALNEVSSLDVADSTLKRLNQAGLQYSIQFGESASNYVRSAYDIQSAIDGLAGDDLPRFTTAAGTLAKATKANVTDITSYFGTMYGIFKNQANEMGKGTWVEMLAGQTAQAVQMFKTTGPEMSAAFESIGAGATTMGVKLNEQMAVLGSLQSTMSGSEAGTKYSAFLQGLSGAEGKLGLKFTDESGKLLPIVDILDKIKAKTKGLNALQMQNVLSGAFGSDEAVSFIKLMSTDVNKLAGDINKLGHINGMKKAIDMAKKMKDPFAQIAAGFRGISIAIWQKALPAITPFIDRITDATMVIVAWTDKYPHLAKAIGLVITSVIGFMAVTGVALVVIGSLKFALIGLGIVAKFTGLKFVSLKIKMAAVWLYTKLLKIGLRQLFLSGSGSRKFFSALISGFSTAAKASWAFAKSLIANPLTWVVLGIAALVAAIVGLVYYWDEVTKAVSKGWNWLKNLFENNAWMKLVFAPLYAGVIAIDTVIKAFGKIPQWWGDFQVWLGAMSIIPVWDLHLEMFDSIKQWWTNFKGWLSALDPFAFLGEKVDWIKNKLSWLPGIDTNTRSTQEVISKVESQAETVNKSVVLPGAESSQSASESGGLFQTISNMFGGSKKSVHVEKMEVNNNGQAVRGADLLYQLEMEAG